MSGAPTEAEILSGMQKATAAMLGKGGKSAQSAPETPEPPRDAAPLRNVIDRIIRLEEEKADTASAIKDIYTEADSAGYSKKALRVIVKREMETADKKSAREQTESDVEIMLSALGDFASSPLGDAAVKKARQ